MHFFFSQPPKVCFQTPNIGQSLFTYFFTIISKVFVLKTSQNDFNIGFEGVIHIYTFFFPEFVFEDSSSEHVSGVFLAPEGENLNSGGGFRRGWGMLNFRIDRRISSRLLSLVRIKV